MVIAREEIFGPVPAVLRADSEDEAVRIANDSEYGLAGGVWSADQDRAIAVARRLRTGQVAVTKAWFYPALAAAVRPGDPEAAAAFVRHLDSPRRVVLEVVPEGRIGFDSTRMWQDTPDAARRD